MEIVLCTVLNEIREIMSMSLSFVVEAVMMLPSRRETIYTGCLPSTIHAISKCGHLEHHDIWTCELWAMAEGALELFKE